MSSGYYEDLANKVAKIFSRDEARRQRIIAQFPQFAMDSSPEVSSRELAVRVLAALGAPKAPANVDPAEMLDCYIAGRKSAGYHASGERHWRNFSGAVMDGSDVGGEDFISKYLDDRA